MKTNQDYKKAALAALKGHWAPAVLCSVVYMLVAVASSIVMQFVDPETISTGALFTIFLSSMGISIFVLMPMQVGYYNTHKELLAGDDAVTGNMFRIGFSKWGRNVWGMFLQGLFIFLWSLLLVIPGIIKSFSYALTPYILADNPELSANEAINLSQKMMKGHKFDCFWLCISFIGWILLGLLTLCIGYFWMMPYMYTSLAAFYQDVKADYEMKNNTIN